MRKIAVSALLGSLALAVACSDSTTPTASSSGMASSSGASGTSSSGMASSSGMTTSSSSSGGVPVEAGATVTCAQYCADAKANCTTTNLQYGSDAECMASCATFPAGSPGTTSGNSLACRAYHVGVAKTAPATHCAHANAFGGRQAEEQCGGHCENFCQLAVATCATQFPTVTACMRECSGLALDPTNKEFGKQAASSGKTFNCRSYHLTAALSDPGTHCGHAAGVGACN
jgi:hypothetical protein